MTTLPPPGQCLLLTCPLRDLPPTVYILLSVVDARALLCMAGEDEETGDVVTTDRLYTVNVYDLAACFKPTPVRLELPH